MTNRLLVRRHRLRSLLLQSRLVRHAIRVRSSRESWLSLGVVVLSSQGASCCIFRVCCQEFFTRVLFTPRVNAITDVVTPLYTSTALLVYLSVVYMYRCYFVFCIIALFSALFYLL